METRTSHGLDQFCTWLQERPGLSILDFAGANQQTISFLTGLGHRVYSDDMVMQLDQSFGSGADAYENQNNQTLAATFLKNSLDFPDDHFDGVLLWDRLEFMAPSLLETVMRRLHRMVRPGSCMLALFHAQEKGDKVATSSYRIADARNLAMVGRNLRQPAQFFNNRGLENLFKDFESVKFFLTRDHLREVIVRR